jgi:hypothetical protein
MQQVIPFQPDHTLSPELQLEQWRVYLLFACSQQRTIATWLTDIEL